MEHFILLLAFLFSFVTMFFGAVSGGVGLVLRPLLIFIGIPSVTVIGSVRVSAVAGDLPGLYVLSKHKKTDWRMTLFLSLPVLLGSICAGLLVVSILKNQLEMVIGIFLILVGALLIISRAGLREGTGKFSPAVRNTTGFLGTFLISFLNTITGGMGPIMGAFYIWLYGKSYIGSSALSRPASYIGSALASVIFIVAGVVDWGLAAVLAIGFGLGSYFGTKYGLKKGERWIRTIVLLVVFASAVKLLFLS
jgi:uncharacterized protein